MHSAFEFWKVRPRKRPDNGPIGPHGLVHTLANNILANNEPVQPIIEPNGTVHPANTIVEETNPSLSTVDSVVEGSYFCIYINKNMYFTNSYRNFKKCE